MKFIDNPNDKTVKFLNSLNHKKYRDKYSKFFDEGEKNILTSLKSDYKIEQLFVTEDYKNKNNLDIYKTDDIFILSDNLFKKVSDTVTSQGIIAIYSYKKKSLSELKDFFVVVLDEVQDPGNVGTIIRSSHAFGVNSIIYTKGTVDIFSPKVVRSSMGSIYSMGVYYLENIEELKKVGYKIFSTSLDTYKTIDNLTFDSKSAIVLGNESRGISREIMKKSDELFKISMVGDIDSLNVSVAGSIILYEISKKFGK